MLATALTLTLGACDKQEDKKDGEGDKAKDDKPSLHLSNDTDACRNALKCCEEMVKAEKGEAARAVSHASPAISSAAPLDA